MDPFGFVVLTAIFSCIFLVFLAINVGRARARYKVPLPDQYTTDPSKKIFNCYQRAYMNTQENFPIYLVLLFLGGQAFPVISSVAGLIYIFGRFLYAQGYYTGVPENRVRGWPSYIGTLVLLGCSIAYALDKLDVIDI